MPIIHEKPTDNSTIQVVLQPQSDVSQIKEITNSDTNWAVIIGICLVIGLLSKPLWSIIGFIIRMFALFVAVVVGLFILVQI